MKPREILLKAFVREKRKERGLRLIRPNRDLARGHLVKADHNLIVMTDLKNLNHTDWVAVTAYYAMYQAATAILAATGLDSKDHATTVAALEYFFGEKMDAFLLEKFNELKEKKDRFEQLKIGEKLLDYFWKAKQSRETIQYGIETTYQETELVTKNAREFVTKIKLILEELDEKVVKIIGQEARRLYNSS